MEVLKLYLYGARESGELGSEKHHDDVGKKVLLKDRLLRGWPQERVKARYKPKSNCEEGRFQKRVSKETWLEVGYGLWTERLGPRGARLWKMPRET